MNMPKVDYIILCDSAVVGPDGKKTFYGLFDRINTSALPFNHHSLFIATRLSEGEGKHKLGIKIFDKEGKEVFKSPEDVNIEFKGPFGSVEFIAQFEGFYFEKDGIYKVMLIFDNTLIESYEKKFEVNVVK